MTFGYTLTLASPMPKWRKHVPGHVLTYLHKKARMGRYLERTALLGVGPALTSGQMAKLSR